MAHYYQTQAETEHRCCDHAGCEGDGMYRAPRTKGNLMDYHWFCLEHVREYNRSWNYCAGMTEEEIENEIRRSTVWDRPTWRIGSNPIYEEQLRHKVYENGGFYAFNPEDREPVTEEGKALKVLGLGENTPFAIAKQKYRELAKLWHPDRNRDDPTAEDKLKKIIAAFNVLKRMRQADKVRA